MNLDDYWQENKRFVLTVVAGVVLFFVGSGVIDSVYGEERRATHSSIQSLKRKLREPLFDAADLERAQTQNEELTAATDELLAKARFVPRPRFVLDRELGSPANQYRRAFADVQETISQRANRANMQFDASLGMPKLSPTNDAEIVRYLEALDLVDQVLSTAIDADIDRVDRIQARLDPGLNSAQGFGKIERTRVTFQMTGDSLAVTRVLTWSQRPPRGRVLALEELEVVPARGKRDEVRADMTFVVPRLAVPEPEE